MSWLLFEFGPIYLINELLKKLGTPYSELPTDSAVRLCVSNYEDILTL